MDKYKLLPVILLISTLLLFILGIYVGLGNIGGLIIFIVMVTMCIIMLIYMYYEKTCNRSQLIICKICGKQFNKHDKNSFLCSDCYKEISKEIGVNIC